MRAVKNNPLYYGVSLLVALVVAMSLLAAKPAYAKTFTVNSTGDGGDTNPGNGSCNTGFRLCSLRAAIQEANKFAGPDTIAFDIGSGTGVKTIKPSSALPHITNPVTIDGYTQPGASENTLAVGNDAVLLIQLNGTNAGNSKNGLVINAPNSVVKGLVINRFKGAGVFLVDSVGNNKVTGNFIGTNPSGVVDMGNSGHGVIMADSNSTVGGTSPAARNVISGNGQDGVDILDSTGNKVQGNYIGTKKDGASPLGNSDDGVQFDQSGSDDNTVGDGNPRDGVANAANTIAFNGGVGVVLLPGSGTGNSILGNSVFSNGDLGIDLNQDGVTQNDLKDPDSRGPNTLQNYPVLMSATTFSGETTIKGKLNSKPEKTFTLRFFSSPVADPSGFGEGKRFIGLKNVTTDSNGDVLAFAFQPAQAVRAGQVVTATATDPEGNTSEFSEALGVVVP